MSKKKKKKQKKAGKLWNKIKKFIPKSKSKRTKKKYEKLSKYEPVKSQSIKNESVKSEKAKPKTSPEDLNRLKEMYRPFVREANERINILEYKGLNSTALENLKDSGEDYFDIDSLNTKEEIIANTLSSYMGKIKD